MSDCRKLNMPKNNNPIDSVMEEFEKVAFEVVNVSGMEPNPDVPEPYQGLVVSLGDAMEISQKTIKAVLGEEREELKHNIGQLRQWLNERSSGDLLTNKDLEIWLLQTKQKTQEI